MYFYPIHGEYKEKMYNAVEKLHQEKVDRLAQKTTN